MTGVSEVGRELRRRQLRVPGIGENFRVLLVGPLMLTLVMGCGAPSTEEQVERTDDVARSAELLAEVMDADRVFARSVASGGLDAWVGAFSADGAMIPPSGPVTTGHPAIRETMTAAFQTPGFGLVWEPLGGEVAASGDLAYTFGNYESSIDSEVATRGRYITVWRRNGDGEWKVVADIGNRERPEGQGFTE